jgi:hypothetical protein
MPVDNRHAVCLSLFAGGTGSIPGHERSWELPLGPVGRARGPGQLNFFCGVTGGQAVSGQSANDLNDRGVKQRVEPAQNNFNLAGPGGGLGA